MKLEHPFPQKIKHSPHKWVLKSYWQKKTLLFRRHISNIISTRNKTYLIYQAHFFTIHRQQIILYIHLLIIAITQSMPTKKRCNYNVDRLFIYSSRRKKNRNNASNIQLHFNLDTSYLVASNVKSRILGDFYLSDKYKQD